jgi:LysR family transcriptional regulator, carnitine catabolism transcriptional activator
VRIQVTLAQLEAVVSVAGHNSFSKAATSLLMSQSSVSRTVAQVERMCGVRLFERSTRQLELTDEGEQFVRSATHILDTYRQQIADFEAFLGGTKGVLRLAALPSLAACLLPPMIMRFRDRYPEILVEVDDVLATQIVDHVRSGAVDLAVTAAPAGPQRDAMSGPGIQFEPIAVDHFYCVLPGTHHLAGKSRIEWTDLVAEAFIAFDEASSVRIITDVALSDHGVTPSRVISARNVASIAGMCAAGLGVSAAPGFVLPLMSVPGLVTRPIGSVPVVREIGVLRDTRRRPSPVARQFLDIIGSLANDIPLPTGAYWLEAADDGYPTSGECRYQ